jgi:serine/threonine protein kinase
MPSGDTPDLNLLFPQRTAAPEQKLFGRYTLKRVLGRGGMGIVWMAHDDELHRHVAMKFLPDMLIRDREAVNDLKRETRRSLDLTHHHIVRIYDFTQDDVCAAIIMEYVDGETLSAMKTQQPGGCFSVSNVAAWVAHFCQALDYAHRQARVVHRDLKPANLMVNSRGDLKVTDFGISRSMSDSMTRVSMSNTAGTLAYMSPEQALGAPPAACDDVYAFGATVYDLLTGRPPFFRGNIQVQLETVIPPKMAARRDELGNQGEPIPDLWEEAIAACLAKRPNDRPQGMSEIAAMLGLAAPSSSLRTTFAPGHASGAGTGGPGTASTRARTSATEEAATRTDSVPPAPQTTRPGTAGTRGTPYVSTPRPTALRDVIPGFVEEPADSPSAEAPPPQPPATAPTQRKADTGQPSSEAPVAIEPGPAIEVSAPIEAPSELIAAEPPIEEPQAISELKPLADVPASIASESAPAVAEAVDQVEPPDIETPAPFVEAEFIVEQTEPPESEAPPVEAELAASVSRAADFPTLLGEPLIEPAASAAEEIPTIELPPDQADAALPEPEAEAAAQATSQNTTPVDEAAATLMDAPLPELPPAAPVSPIPPAMITPKRETLRSFSAPVNEAVSPPARRRPIPWVPIAAAAGIAAIAGVWMVIPKDKGKHEPPNPQSTTPRPVNPTPVPIVTDSETKLQRARALVSSQEFPEAIALLKGIRQLEPENAEAIRLLTEIDKIQQEQAAKAAMAKRQQDIDALLTQSEIAMDREQWAEMRSALEKVVQLDPQNSSAIAQLNNLKDAETEWTRAEEQRQTEQKEAEDRERQRRIAAMQQQQQAEDERRNAQERPRNTARDDTPSKKPKATPRPQRARDDDDSSDRPPRRATASREDDRPPASTRVQPVRRATPAPAPSPSVQPGRRQNVFKGGAPGG